MTVVSLEAEATHLPTAIEVSIEGRTAGEHIHASDLVLPKGSVLLADAEALVVNISEATEVADEKRPPPRLRSRVIPADSPAAGSLRGPAAVVSARRPRRTALTARRLTAHRRTDP